MTKITKLANTINSLVDDIYYHLTVYYECDLQSRGYRAISTEKPKEYLQKIRNCVEQLKECGTEDTTQTDRITNCEIAITQILSQFNMDFTNSQFKRRMCNIKTSKEIDPKQQPSSAVRLSKLHVWKCPDCSWTNELEPSDSEDFEMEYVKCRKCGHVFNLNYAIYTNDIERVKLVSGLGVKPSNSSLNAAIKTKNIEMVKLVAGLGAKIDEYSLNIAIWTKNIEIVKFVSGLGVKPNEYSLNVAIYTKNIKMVEFVSGLGVKTN